VFLQLPRTNRIVKTISGITSTARRNPGREGMKEKYPPQIMDQSHSRNGGEITTQTPSCMSGREMKISSQIRSQVVRVSRELIQVRKKRKRLFMLLNKHPINTRRLNKKPKRFTLEKQFSFVMKWAWIQRD